VGGNKKQRVQAANQYDVTMAQRVVDPLLGYLDRRKDIG